MSDFEPKTSLSRLPYSLHLAFGVILGIWKTSFLDDDTIIELVTTPTAVAGLVVAAGLATWLFRTRSSPAPLNWLVVGIVLGGASHASFKSTYYGESSLFEMLPLGETVQIEA